MIDSVALAVVLWWMLLVLKLVRRARGAAAK